MNIPPYDSVDYITWSSHVTGATLRYFISDFDHHQIDQLRQLLAGSYWQQLRTGQITQRQGQSKRLMSSCGTSQFMTFCLIW